MRKTTFFLFFLLLIFHAEAQKPVPNSTAKPPAKQATKTVIDSFAYYDELFSELESFLDSITAPRSFATINVGISNGYFSYQNGTGSNAMNVNKQLLFAPSAGYYHKSGLGASVSASVIKESGSFNMYQVATTGSYDYLQNRAFMAGLSYTHFFTKDSLNFYTSPLTNEWYAYFSYRKTWIKPAVAVSYGWGSRTNVEERKEKIKLLRGKPINSTTTIETVESINDLTVTASVKHDFYWLNVLTEKDFFRVTPQLSLVSGTQRFGLNQVNNSYMTDKKGNVNVLYNSENINLSDESKFQPLSLSARIRTEFSKGKFFLQPQLMLDYYLPVKEKNLSTAFAINTGLML